MRPYVIFADSACDIAPDVLSLWGVRFCPLTFTFQGEDTEYENNTMPIDDFYAKMRAGGVAKTSAVNPDRFQTGFEEAIAQGNDVLYIGFSSGLSTTYHSAEIAAKSCLALHPDAKILTVDSLGASAGYGLLLRLAVLEKESGKSIEQVAAFVEENRLRVCHVFTVDDLVYLKRGGRVSPTAAVIGNLLGIKPVLHVDDEGHLIPLTKVKGRKNAVRALADLLGRSIADASAPVFISHGDCREDADLLCRILSEQYGATVELVTDVGPVIGAHSGPGTLALFFMTDKPR